MLFLTKKGFYIYIYMIRKTEAQVSPAAPTVPTKVVTQFFSNFVTMAFYSAYC